MNKNKYKLIFSKARSCLIPVADFASSIARDKKQLSSKDDYTDDSQEEYNLSLIAKTVMLQTSILSFFNWKNIPIITLLSMSSVTFANTIQVDSHNAQTKVSLTQNNVAIIDIAKPEKDGVSDNRFEKFSTQNGAVFKNNLNGMDSELVAYLDKNKNLDDQAAKTILTQVTGSEMSNIKGGLEVLGNKADLFIINPNGINLNGVQTFNTDRFVASTSQVIDPKKGLNLEVTKGQITIGKDGLATDGLKYLEILAKKIEQKGAITHSKATQGSKEANITLAAGSLNYNAKDRTLTSRNQSSTEIAITGDETGAMHGNHIRLITTDTGAGVNHKGVIISESDLVFETKQGNIDIGTVQATNKIEIKNTANTMISHDLKAKHINVDSGKTSVAKDVKIKAIEDIIVKGHDFTVESDAKVSSKNIKLNTKKNNINKNAKLVTTTLNVSGYSLNNSGNIYSRFSTILVSNLNNKGNILSEKDLSLSVLGNTTQHIPAQVGFDEYFITKNHYVNSGVIQGNNVTLIFSNGSNYSQKVHNLPLAKENLYFNVKDFELNDREELQFGNSFSLNSNNFTNKGTLTSGNKLQITTNNTLINEGLLGAKNNLSLISLSGDIKNKSKGILHSDGISHFSSNNTVYNLGEIISKDKITIEAQGLLNDVEIKGKVRTIQKSDKKTHIDYGPLQSDYYTIEIKYPEFNGSDLIAESVGKIYSENGLEFVQKNKKVKDLNQGIINHGIINVKGELKSNNATQIVNQAKSEAKRFFIDYLLKDIEISVKFQPRSTIINTPLDGEATYTYKNIVGLINDILKRPNKFHTNLYSSNIKHILLALKKVEIPELQKALTIALGQNWETQDLSTLKANWNKTRKRKRPVYFYSEQKAILLTDKLSGEAKLLQNGEHVESGKFKQNEIEVGKHSIIVPNVQFKSFTNEIKETENEDNVDLSILLELLGNPNLFIDRSLRLEKKEIQKPNIQPEIEDEDKNLLTETEEEKLKAKKEAERKAQEKLEKEKKAQEELARKEKEEAEREREKKEKAEIERKQKEEAELAQKQKLLIESQKKAQAELEKKQKELLEKQKLEQEELEKQKLLQLALEKKKKELLDKQRKEKEILEKQEQALLDKQKQKQEELLKKQKLEQEKLEKQKLSQLDLEKQKKELLDKQRKEKEILEKRNQALLEKQRQEQEELLKKQKLEQEEIEKQKLSQLALEKQKKELLEKQRKEKEVLEKQKQALLEKQKLEQEELKKQHQEKIELEKQKSEQLELERQRLIDEYEKKLAEEKRLLEEYEKAHTISVDQNRPKVKIDSIYQTRINYIDQNEYLGADYFFNTIVPLDNLKEKDNVGVIGDNYFDNQLILRSIEKKVGNHLSLKYDLSNTKLVKKLMDNAHFAAKEMNIELGKALTKEQQEQLKEDIVWYVKTKVSGKEVFVPQVYFSPSTLADAKKYQGLGNAVIQSRELYLKTKNVHNQGTIIGDRVELEAENKVINEGLISTKEQVKLIGHKGVESRATAYADENGHTYLQKSSIESEGHVHLEADLDSNVEITASDVKGNTGFIKGKDFNLKDSHETYSEHKEEELRFLVGGGGRSESRSEVNSVGSDVQFDHLHLAINHDVNQEGSTLKSKHLTGVVKGDYNTKGGQNLKNIERSEKTLGLGVSGSISGGGHTASFSADGKDGFKSNVEESNHAGAIVDLYLKGTSKEETETTLTHTNSKLSAETGKLNILGKADIGGVDINDDLPIEDNPIAKGSEPESEPKNKETVEHKEENSEASDPELAKIKHQQDRDKALARLSEQEINELMAEKDESFYEQHRSEAFRNKAQGFELSASEVTSTKQKDEFDKTSKSYEFKVGGESELHSAVADTVTSVTTQVRDAERGLKRDEATASLQNISDIANLITGDTGGGSVKAKVEYSSENMHVNEKSDVRTHIGGNTKLTARSGSIELNNVESNKNSQLSLTAKENVNVNSGKTERTEHSDSLRLKLSSGATVSCGVMSQGCAVGTVAGIDGGQQKSDSQSLIHQNSLLQGDIAVSTGDDFNLAGANIKADKLDLDVKGKTNIVSQQDTYTRKNEGYDYSTSVGAAVTTSLSIKPTLSVGGGYSLENEASTKVNEKSGIEANQVMGQINDVNQTAGYFIDNSGGKGLHINGKIINYSLNDSHQQDGGSFGASTGLNESGTTSFNVRGGRSEQKHYQATQNSVVSGVAKDKVAGEYSRDLSHSTKVHQDDVVARTQFNFEILDLVEVGQKVKGKAKSLLNKRSDSVDNSQLHSQQSDTEYSLVQKPKGNAEPIYEEIPESVYSKVENKAKAGVESEYSLVQKTKGNGEPIYEEIPESAYSKVGHKAKTGVESEYSLVQKPKGNGEPIYEEIPESAYSKVGHKAKTGVESEYSLVQKPKGNAEPIYEEIPESAYSKVGHKAKVGVESEYSLVQKPKGNAEPIYEEIPESAYSKVGNKAKAGVESEYSLVQKPKGNAEPIYEETPESVYSKVGNKAKTGVESEYSLVQKPKGNAEPIYEEIPESAYSKVGNKAKAGLESEYSLAQKPKGNAEPIYEEMPESPYSKVGNKADTSVEKKQDLAKRPLPELPLSLNQPNKAANESEYEEIVSRKPDIQGENESSYTTINHIVKSEGNNKAISSLAELNSNNSNNVLVETTQTGTDSGLGSFFNRLKNLFKTTPKVQKAPTESVDVTKSGHDDNLDNLDDPSNLRNLLALEKQRNEDFENHILKDEAFLNNAIEKGRGKVDPALTDMLASLPDKGAEILADPIVKLERKINKVLNFKPNAEEFVEIQTLVKQLPKGSPTDMDTQTKSIIEALANTSNTIKRSPSLQEEISQGINKFLKESEGKQLTVEMIEELNHSLRPDEGIDRKLYKEDNLTKENAIFSSPESSRLLLKQLVDYVNTAKQQNVEPAVLAGLVYQRLIAYHPFAEGNGRTARVLVNKLLQESGYPTFEKFSEKFESRILPQTGDDAGNEASSQQVLKEFLGLLGKRQIAQGKKIEGTTPISENNRAKSDLDTANDVIESDYAEISDLMPKVKNVPESEAKTDELEPQVEVTKKAESEDIYAKVDKSPEGLARVKERADQKVAESSVKPMESEEVPPALPARPKAEDKNVEDSLKEMPINDSVLSRELIDQRRPILQQIKDKFQPLKVGNRIKAVRESVEKFGGKVTFKFAQSKGEVFNEIIKHAETQNGVCEATCAFWITKQVDQKDSLWKDIYSDGEEKGKLNKQAFAQIKKLQTAFIKSGSNALQQFKFTESWLGEQGVVPKEKHIDGYSRKDEVTGTVTSKNVDSLVKSILDTGEQNTGVKKISINIRGGSHTVAAAVRGNKVVFFDPNFGEIEFDSHSQFEKWFKSAFWEKSGYAGKDSGKRFFNIVNFSTK